MKNLLLITFLSFLACTNSHANIIERSGTYMVQEDKECPSFTTKSHYFPILAMADRGMLVLDFKEDGRGISLNMQVANNGRYEVWVPLFHTTHESKYHRKAKIKVDEDSFSFKSKGQNRFGRCDVIGLTFPCLDKYQWEHEWKFEFNGNDLIYTWKENKEAGSCLFSKL